MREMAHTVIVGSGIIGLSTAYCLSDHQPGSTIHLVDSSPRLFASASGYAGGFLAKDWFSTPSLSLAELSYVEHEKLAAAENGREKWGYTKSVTVSYEPGGRRPDGKRGEDWLLDGTSRAGVVSERTWEGGDAPRWLRRSDGDAVSVIDGDGGTAVVDPLQLCEFLLAKCKAAGVHIHHPATVLSTNADVRGELASVVIGYTDSSTESEIPATRLLLSAGAWTPQVLSSLFPRASVKIPVGSLAGHSLVVKTPVVDLEREDGEEKSFSVYASYEDLAVEAYARTNGVIYLAGVNSSSIPLPLLATGTELQTDSLNRMKSIAKTLINTGDKELEVVREGLCFRPITRRGTPILARLRDEDLGPGYTTRGGEEGGVFVAVGHGPWGISLSLGTGKVMAEMMQGRKLSADISELGL